MYTRTIPKGHDNPLAEGKYHYRYDDPHDMDHIDCIDCHAPYGYQWTNKDKESGNPNQNSEDDVVKK